MQSFNSAAFSIAMSGTEPRVHISWKHENSGYHMAHIESFLLQRPDDFLGLRKLVRNIINWGKNERLDKIRSSLDILRGESEKVASLASRE